MPARLIIAGLFSGSLRIALLDLGSQLLLRSNRNSEEIISYYMGLILSFACSGISEVTGVEYYRFGCQVGLKTQPLKFLFWIAVIRLATLAMPLTLHSQYCQEDEIASYCNLLR